MADDDHVAERQLVALIRQLDAKCGGRSMRAMVALLEELEQLGVPPATFVQALVNAIAADTGMAKRLRDMSPPKIAEKMLETLDGFFGLLDPAKVEEVTAELRKQLASSRLCTEWAAAQGRAGS